ATCQIEPFASCKALLTAFPKTPDGVYTIDPDGVGPLAGRSMYCDMTTDGGGWSLVAALANRQPRKPAPAAFFTETFKANATTWQKQISNPLLSPKGRGVLKINHWPAPTAIRYRMIDTLTGVVVNKMVIADFASIQHMRQFTTARHKRTGKARVTVLKPTPSQRVVYDANDSKATWGYDAIFGRFQDTSQAGWQFGLSVNLPDNQKGYNGVHDDKGRTELNLGVAGYQPWTADISGYWPGTCDKSCSNEDWAIKLAAGRAVVEVWHSTFKTAFASCKALLKAFPGTPDGVYPIDPDGKGPIAAVNLFCDMNNGGWTLVGNYYDSAGDDMPNETK
ncbi:MAG TPA: hypothetical protein DCQ06_02185, partial [Myxococcales bacterium]|nr:hypothetical protein [Myxococcales bacterium]